MELREVFEFVTHEREDVRKMAIQGLTQVGDTSAVVDYITNNPQCANQLVSQLVVSNKPLLGDLLSLLINLSAYPSTAEQFVSNRIIPRIMRLLAAQLQQKSSDSANDKESEGEAKNAKVLRLMLFMLLNNLTATHMSAVEQFLQVEDEDLRGYYLETLKKYCTSAERFAEETNSSPLAVDDLERWAVSVTLNITQHRDGQALLFDDDDWLELLPHYVNAKQCADGRCRLSVLQLYRNCSVNKTLHSKIAEAKVVPELVKADLPLDILTFGVDLCANLVTSPEGIEYLESLNLKRFCTEQVVPKLEEMGTGDAQKLVHRLKMEVLPSLEELQDVYLANEGEQAASGEGQMIPPEQRVKTAEQNINVDDRNDLEEIE